MVCPPPPMMAPCGREPAAGPPLLSPRVFVGRAQLSGDPVPPRAAAPLCPRPGLQTLAWTAPRSALVSLDGCARPPGSPRSLFWGSRLRKVRGTVPSDLFKGLAASRLPPPLPPTPPASPSVASFLSLYRIRLLHCVPRAGNNCSRPDRLC